MSSYQQAVERLYELGHELARTPAHKFDLEQMRVLARGLGDPQRRFPAVLIAGTNGKGSTAATLASILQAAGHRTGLYTSPHLLSVNERIRLDGATISDAEFAAVYERVDEVARRLVASGELPHAPSFFEMLTAMAFEFFAMTAVDIAVLEVGMGGRLDATNAADPIVSVIADIALDHQKFLGDTIAEIAREKAGIIRANGVVATLPQHPQANDVLGRAIQDAGARAVSAVSFVPPVSPGAEAVWSADSGSAGRNRYPLAVMGREIIVDSPLGGRHQLRNLALAIATAIELDAAGFRVTADDIERGIRETRWPGRFQVLQGAPAVVFDVAHNPAGAWALRAAISERFPGRKLAIVFGAMRDKAIGEMAQILFPIADAVVLTHAASPRAATTEEIREAAARTGCEPLLEDDVPRAVERARELAGADGLVVVTGSIYVVGAAMDALKVSVG
jgi:dihydrofolate synthase / folylpolyglutamate synthase